MRIIEFQFGSFDYAWLLQISGGDDSDSKKDNDENNSYRGVSILYTRAELKIPVVVSKVTFFYVFKGQLSAPSQKSCASSLTFTAILTIKEN